ncbi:MAG TPA: helix-hairpin-helix domain-containing protein [Burkholderiaceae bacterium]|nr:helix-hairpin-helix domain-containing protein [Burkholderiaceae bacterium]
MRTRRFLCPRPWRLPLRHLGAIALLGLSMQNGHALDINQASEADLDAIRGSGPALTARILAARQQAPFNSWPDLMRRVKGIGAATARKWSEQGVTVNGQPWASPAP